MKPLIEKIPKIGASVKTTQNQFLSYNGLIHRNCNCIYPFTGATPNGEYFAINISAPIYNEIVKKGASVPINSIEDINLLKYIINKLY